MLWLFTKKGTLVFEQVYQLSENEKRNALFYSCKLQKITMAYMPVELHVTEPTPGPFLKMVILLVF